MLGLIEEQGLAAQRAARVFVDIGQFMDQVLLAMVSSHEAALQADNLPFGHSGQGISTGQIGDA